MNEIIKKTQSRIANLRKESGLDLPDNYSVGNAMNSAYLKLQQTKDKNKNPVLTVCSKTSIANALLDMVIQGLSPSKDQCYFVAYGKTLTLMRSYHGTKAAAKRISDIQDVVARVVYKDDIFNYKILKGNIKIEKHEQSFQNRKAEHAIGAYAVIFFNDSRPEYVEMMNLDEIENAWSQGKIFKKGQKQTHIPHHKFKSEMMKKTVTTRACKKYINSSNDNSLYAESFNRADVVRVEEETREQIEAKANTEDFDEAVEDEVPEEVQDDIEEAKATHDYRAYGNKTDMKKEVQASGKQENIENNEFVKAAEEHAKKQKEKFEKEQKKTTKNKHFLNAIKELQGKVPFEDYAALKEKYEIEDANEILDKKKQIKFYNDLRNLAGE